MAQCFPERHRATGRRKLIAILGGIRG